MFQNLLSLFLASTLSFSSISMEEENSFDAKSLLSVSPLPIQKEDMESPGTLYADSALAIDLETQSILYEKNSFKRRPVASLTKLMTAYIVLKENDPSSIVTVSAHAAETQGSRMGLKTGEQISVRNLLYGLLIESGNDAAVALAEFNAGDESSFIKK
ncbi:D-alanyl-D-alanine carboxypeptidase [Candidatus Peregrinibacteria bacterium]|nr:MAG: D-alanyl-D-alanine carboxypeptidase [Candidatus Peregrinibacteria bacterium]